MTCSRSVARDPLRLGAILLFFAVFAVACGGEAQRFDVDGITVVDPRAPATAGTAGEVYMTVTSVNNGAIVGAEVAADIAAAVEVRADIDQIDLLAGRPSILQAGGSHLALTELNSALEAGSSFEVTLILHDGTEVPVLVEVRG